MSSSTLVAAAAEAPRQLRRRQRLVKAVMTMHLSVFRSLHLPCRDWAGLPPELISCILHKLDHVQIMLGADKVCRSWRRAARDEPELWRRIDMRGYGDLSHRDLADLNQMAMDAVLRSKGQCEAFWGDRAGDSSDFLSFLADQVPLLRSLILISCDELSYGGLWVAIERFTQLEELELSECEYVSHEGVFEVVSKACPRLKHFRYSHKPRYYESCFWCDHRDNNSESEGREAIAIATMLELRSLQLVYSRITNEVLMAILDNCSHMESLNISNCHRIVMDSALRAKCSQRNTKVLLTNDPADEYGERREIKVCPVNECSTCLDYFERNNRRGYWRNSTRANDDEPLVIATVREVRSLQLYRNDLTSQGLEAITNKFPHLKSIDIHNCRDIIMNNTLQAKHAQIKTKELARKLLAQSSSRLDPNYLDTHHCRNVIMKKCTYINFNGSKATEMILRKRIRNYCRKNKKLMAKLIQDDLDYKECHPEEYEPCRLLSECSTCLMLEYFDQRRKDDLEDYADYYDPSYGLDSHDNTDFQVHDGMLSKRLRRYPKLE
ncbi:unnamed protein product [Urochloa decumbens]|uniref:F-box domain-containing protein n=1 Tax=Urochloa decumbens TaxID=240449 RepID=A0ABC9GB42_9POAL